MKNKLSTFEASCIITGYGIGSGVLAMPYIANKCGIIFTIIILLLAYIFSYCLHLMIADISIKSEGDGQIVSILSNYLPSGKLKKPVTIFLFVLLAIVLYTNLAVYIAGASEILNAELGLPIYLSKIIFFVFAAVVAMFGLKILGICEKYAIFAIFIVILALAIGSIFNIKNSLSINLSSIKDLISFFSVSMFAFVAFFSVPQVVVGLNKDTKAIKKSISIGMLMNLAIMIIVILGAILSSSEITEVSMIGWSNGIGVWAKILGSTFTILAMLTTYWSISTALRDIVSESIKLDPKLCFIIASIPSLLIAFIPSTNFLSFLELTSGAIAILIALFLIPVFHISHKNSESILKKFACLATEIVIFIAYMLMAIGSLI